MTRPAETIQAIVSAIVGAVLIIVGAIDDGLDLSDLSNPEVVGAISVLVGFVSAAVTYITAKRQRAGELVSNGDGAVVRPG